MKQARSFVEARRDLLCKRVHELGHVSIAQLAEEMGVSPLTIRRDIQLLQKMGLVAHRYGEALVPEKPEVESDVRVREELKHAIAKKAASYVLPGDSVFVNTSSTALMTISEVSADNVTVITNSSKASEIEANRNMTILITGGQVSMPRGVLSGEFALANLRTVSVHHCFVGCAGVSPTAGVTSTTLQEATVNALMLEKAERRFLLADSSKIGVEAGFRYADLSDIDVLITDDLVDPHMVDRLTQAGVKQVVRVPVQLFG